MFSASILLKLPLAIKVQWRLAEFCAHSKHQYWVPVEWGLWISGDGVVERAREALEIKIQNERLCMKSICVGVIGSLPWFEQLPWRGWVCAVGLVLWNCTPGMCQTTMWGVQRSPDLTQSSNQLNYYPQKQMMKDLISSRWAIAPCCSPPDAAWRAYDETGSHLPAISISNSETLMSSPNLSSSAFKYHCLGPWTQNTHLTH